MTTTRISDGQSLVDVAVQQYGSVAALFELADANGVAITDLLTPGQVLQVPDSGAAVPAVVRYFSGRGQRINTGAPVPTPIIEKRDFKRIDFKTIDFK